MRTLTAERDRLATRLGMVEREMGDLTGSISRTAGDGQDQTLDPKMLPTPMAATAPQFAPPATINARAPRAAPPVRPAASLEPRAVTVMTVPAPAAMQPLLNANAEDSQAVPLPTPRPSELIAAATQDTPAVPPDAGPATATPNGQPDATPMSAPATPAAKPAIDLAARVPMGVDLGAAPTMARLRARWASFRATYGSLADGLRPVITIREVNPAKPPEMRLVVGPLADASAAARLCATLAGSQFACHPAAFDGQRLALR